MAIKSGDKKTAAKTAAQKYAIIDYLTENVSAKSSELAELVGVKSSRIKVILNEMISERTVVSEGGQPKQNLSSEKLINHRPPAIIARRAAFLWAADAIQNSAIPQPFFIYRLSSQRYFNCSIV
ncbi:MAG: hypothetical protein LUH43_02500 [Clostridia bacterium]|nr:hypothetical protein [Clostridia bacterium]